MHLFQVNLFQLYSMTSNVFDGDYENPSKCTIIAVFQKEHEPAYKSSFQGWKLKFGNRPILSLSVLFTRPALTQSQSNS